MRSASFCHSDPSEPAHFARDKVVKTLLMRFNACVGGEEKAIATDLLSCAFTVVCCVHSPL
jgi:hypothetical protein